MTVRVRVAAAAAAVVVVVGAGLFSRADRHLTIDTPTAPTTTTRVASDLVSFIDVYETIDRQLAERWLDEAATAARVEAEVSALIDAELARRAAVQPRVSSSGAPYVAQGSIPGDCTAPGGGWRGIPDAIIYGDGTHPGESGGDYCAMSPPEFCGGYRCVGKYQFDTRHFTTWGTCSDLSLSPNDQDECARRISNNGQNLAPWGR